MVQTAVTQVVKTLNDVHQLYEVLQILKGIVQTVLHQ